MTKGFTLIELLVVVTIIVLSGALLIPRLIQFKDSQDINDAANKLQTALKQVQNNAVSGFNCGDNYNPQTVAVDWHMVFQNNLYYLEPSCSSGANIPKTTFSLPADIQISKVCFDNTQNNGSASPTPTVAPANCYYGIGSRVTFSNVKGVVGFVDSNSTVLPSARAVIVLQSNSTSQTYGVFVEKGGLIYTGPAN